MFKISLIQSVSERLFTAATEGNIQVVQKLLKKATAEDVNNHKRNEDDATPLIKAVHNGHTETARLLIAFPGVDVNAQNANGRTALNIAAEKGFTEIVRLLLTHSKIDLHLQTADGCPPLVYAAGEGHTEVVKLFLDQRELNINAQNLLEWTALHIAANLGHTGVVRLLLTRRDVDLTKMDKWGRTALELASKDEIIELIHDYMTSMADEQLANERSERNDSTESVPAKPPLGRANARTFRPKPQLTSDKSGPMIFARASSLKNGGLLRPASEPVLDHVPVHQTRAPVLPVSDSPLVPAPIPAFKPELPPPPPVQQPSPGSASPGTTPIRNWLAARLHHLNPVHVLHHHVSSPSSPASTTTPSFTFPEDLATVSTAPPTESTPSADGAPGVAESATVSPLVREPSIALPPPVVTWLGARLRNSGLDEQLIRDCEQKLVIKEGFAMESDFADLAAEQVNFAYLQSIDINGKGIQNRLIRLHRELLLEYGPPSSAANAPELITARFQCGLVPIEGIQDFFGGPGMHLRAPSERLIFRGHFSETITSSVSSRNKTTVYNCVIKCAGSTELSDPDSPGVIALRRECDIFDFLASGTTDTGCISCYYMHPTANYLVLEAHGQDLRSLLNPHLKNAFQVVQAVVTAVSALHSYGIMHGDIKPSNILIRLDELEGYEAKICDLDAAYPVDELVVASTLGTKYYVPPEVYRAGPATVKTTLAIDMFSLGLVIWQVLERSPHPALIAAEEMGATVLEQCYTDHDKLMEFLPMPDKAGYYGEYLGNITSLEPHKRMMAHTLLNKIQRLTTSNAQQDLFTEKTQNNNWVEAKSMLNTLITNTHSIPTLAIVLPVMAPKKKDSIFSCCQGSPMNLVRNRFRLYFMCSHTHKMAPCGPHGKGYEITVTKQWVLDAAPVLMVGLVLLKVALLAGGIPLPVPDISPLLADAGVTQQYLAAAVSMVQNPLSDTGNVNVAIDKIKDLQSNGPTQITDQALTEEGTTFEEGSRKAYETIKALLEKNGTNIALTCGLRQVTHKGKTAWILDDDAVELDYRNTVDSAKK